MRNQPALIAEKIAAKFQRTAKLAADAGIFNQILASVGENVLFVNPDHHELEIG